MLLRGPAKIVEDRAGLDAAEPFFDVDLKHFVEVFRHVENDRGVATLARQTRATAAPGDRRAHLARDRNRGDDIGYRFRNDDADWSLSIIGAVGRVKRAAAIVESDFPAGLGAQLFWEGGALRGR
ncbi:MAG TPA: hypothetical protein VHW03_06925 [Chthoniobacterales bacterium]|jgi:hypothetical protein|nr:hypothetical protein [Chthoniobacterales bacterium]